MPMYDVDSTVNRLKVKVRLTAWKRIYTNQACMLRGETVLNSMYEGGSIDSWGEIKKLTN